MAAAWSVGKSLHEIREFNFQFCALQVRPGRSTQHREDPINLLI
jgi:hypothetical protein